jgi:hypothetical protein
LPQRLKFPSLNTNITKVAFFSQLEMFRIKIRSKQFGGEIVEIIDSVMQVNRALENPVKKVQLHVPWELLRESKSQLCNLFPQDIALELVEVIIPDTRWECPWEELVLR